MGQVQVDNCRMKREKRGEIRSGKVPMQFEAEFGQEIVIMNADDGREDRLQGNSILSSGVELAINDCCRRSTCMTCGCGCWLLFRFLNLQHLTPLHPHMRATPPSKNTSTKAMIASIPMRTCELGYVFGT